jgi:hypothetical protein
MRCPGQDTQYWKQGAIFDAKCPQCGGTVEFFKDDTTRKCPQCGHRFMNPGMDFGCASYCQYAEQCLGDLPAELLAQKEDMLKDRVAVEVKRYFKNDFARIGHATKVARYAERIGKHELANLAVVLPAAYLNDVGRSAAKAGLAETAAGVHDREGVRVAREILEKLKARPALIDAVCAIIGRDWQAAENEGLEFKVVADAERIVNLQELQKHTPVPADQMAALIEGSFMTEGGRREARSVFIEGS